MSCGVGCSHSMDLALVWLWCRPEGAPLVQPLAWELPYGRSAAIKRKKKRESNEGIRREREIEGGREEGKKEEGRRERGREKVREEEGGREGRKEGEEGKTMYYAKGNMLRK